MRIVTFGAANSLDNYIARKDGGTDWLMWSDEVQSLTEDLWKSIDTVVMGRKTYEVALRSGTTAYPGVKNFVFSRTMRTAPDPAVTVIAEDPGEFVGRLKRQPGSGICVMGGGELGRTLLAAGVVDRVGVNVHPVLLGSGIPLFYEMPHAIDLALRESRVLKNGCVYLLYDVKRAGV
jgi:dihydrofolate reductase